MPQGFLPHRPLDRVIPGGAQDAPQDAFLLRAFPARYHPAIDDPVGTQNLFSTSSEDATRKLSLLVPYI